MSGRGSRLRTFSPPRCLYRSILTQIPGNRLTFTLGSWKQLRPCLGSRRRVLLTIFHSVLAVTRTNSLSNDAAQKTCQARLGAVKTASQVQYTFACCTFGR